MSRLVRRIRAPACLHADAPRRLRTPFCELMRRAVAQDVKPASGKRGIKPEPKRGIKPVRGIKSPKKGRKQESDDDEDSKKGKGNIGKGRTAWKGKTKGAAKGKGKTVDSDEEEDEEDDSDDASEGDVKEGKGRGKASSKGKGNVKAGKDFYADENDHSTDETAKGKKGKKGKKSNAENGTEGHRKGMANVNGAMDSAGRRPEESTLAEAGQLQNMQWGVEQLHAQARAAGVDENLLQAIQRGYPSSRAGQFLTVQTLAE